MLSIVHYAKILDGEIDLNKLNIKRKEEPIVIKSKEPKSFDFYCYRKSNGQIALQGVTNLKRVKACNVRFTFDGDSDQLIKMEFI